MGSLSGSLASSGTWSSSLLRQISSREDTAVVSGLAGLQFARAERRTAAPEAPPGSRKRDALTWDVYGRRIKTNQKQGRSRKGGGLDSGQGSGAEGTRDRKYSRSRKQGRPVEGSENGSVDAQDRKSGRGRKSDPIDAATEVAINELAAELRQLTNADEVRAALEISGPVLGDHFENWHRLLDVICKGRGLLQSGKKGSDYSNSVHRWPVMLQVFRYVQGQSWYEPTTYWYSKLISLAGWSQRPDQSWALLLEMQDLGLTPTTAVCNGLIRAFLVGRLEEEAIAVLEKMKESEDCEPNTRTYNMVIQALCARGRLAEAEEYVEELKGRGLEQDEFTYSTLLYAYAVGGHVDQLETSVLDMCQRGVPLHKNNIAQAAISCLGKAARWQALDTLAVQMGNKMVASSVLTWNALIGQFAEAGREKSMESAFAAMKSSQCEPTVTTYKALLEGYRTKQDLSRLPAVTRVLHEMEAQKFPPNSDLSDSYTAAIEAYGALDACDLMAETFSRMLEEGCLPSRATFRALILGFGKAGLVGEMEIVYAMLKDSVSPDGEILCIMEDAYREVGLEEKASEVAHMQVEATGLQEFLPAEKMTRESGGSRRRSKLGGSDSKSEV